MPLSLFPPSTFTLLTLTLTLLFCTLLSPPALAQNFEPSLAKCSTFIEGRALYLFGGEKGDNLMLDLSVPWNASSPVIKTLAGGPKVEGRACAMLNNGEDMLVVTTHTGYLYNLKSNTWSPFNNTNFASTTSLALAATDPETGIIYIPDGGLTWPGQVMTMLSVDMRTESVNPIAFYPDVSLYQAVAWSASLRSLVIADGAHEPLLYTPSLVPGPSNGWSSMTTTGKTGTNINWDCGVSAYGGARMMFLGRDLGNTTAKKTVYVLDTVKRGWTQGPSVPDGFFGPNCAVSGDLFISWGTILPSSNNSTRTLVFNMKTEKWVSRYTVPPPRPTPSTSSNTTQPSETADGSGASGGSRFITIIVAVTVGMLAIFLVCIFLYRRRSRLSNSGRKTTPDASSTRPSETKEPLEAQLPSAYQYEVKDNITTSWKEEIPMEGNIKTSGNLHRRDPSELGRPQPTWYPTASGRLQQGAYGSRESLAHPHAVVVDPTTRRNVQEGATEVRRTMQHPHTTAELRYITQNDKAEW